MQVDDGFTSLSLVGAEPFSYQSHIYQRTGWLDENLKPEHVGVYERDYGDHLREEDVVCSYWNGTRWFSYGSTPARAEERYREGEHTMYQCLAWRGLTKPVMEKL